MFSIKRIPIPLTRKNAKGKAPEPLVLHAVRCLVQTMRIDIGSRECNCTCFHGQDFGPLESQRYSRRFRFLNNSKVDIELPFKEDKIHKVFIDPTGNHVIITTVAGDCYYLHSSKSKVVNLKRFSDYHIESVAWNRAEGTELSTGVSDRLASHL